MVGRACALGALLLIFLFKNTNGGITMEKSLTVRVKPEAILAAEKANQRDFAAIMAAVRREMLMSRFEFLAALSAYLHAEARRDGVVDDPAC